MLICRPDMADWLSTSLPEVPEPKDSNFPDAVG